MKHVFTAIVLIAGVLMTASCSKEYSSPEDLINNSDLVADIKINTRRGEFKNTTTFFRDADVYRKSDYEGQSWFCACSGGKMVYDAVILSIYFECIDNVQVGDRIHPSRCVFSFVFSSDSNATTHEYDGAILLADKGADFVVFRFDKVLFKCSFGEYLIDGYLNCPLFGEYEL